MQRFLGELPFQFTLLQGLRHLIKGAGELAQLVFAVAQTGAGAQIAGRQPRAGAHQRLDRAHDQETAADPAKSEGQAHRGSEPHQTAEQRPIRPGKEQLLGDAQQRRHLSRHQLTVHPARRRRKRECPLESGASTMPSRWLRTVFTSARSGKGWPHDKPDAG